jgi:hypothetical protein
MTREIKRGVANPPPQNRVHRKLQWVVVRANYVIDVVTSVAGHTPRISRHVFQIGSIGGQAESKRNGGVAPNTRTPESPVGLPLPKLVHGGKYGIFRSVGVHAAQPLLVLRGVASFTFFGVHRLGHVQARVAFDAAPGRPEKQQR